MNEQSLSMTPNGSSVLTPKAHLGVHYPGNLLMVVAPSGAGKSSLVNALLTQDKQIKLSISYTTRPKRPTEIAGKDYHFVTVDDFLARHKQGEFLESAQVHGHYYGTSCSWIEAQMTAGHDVLLEIDWQGAQQIRKKFCNAISIFILPPSLEVLKSRLEKRRQDAQPVIARRLLAAGDEIAHARECDYVVINDIFDKALSQLQSIVMATRLRFASQSVRHAVLFSNLGIPAAVF